MLSILDNSYWFMATFFIRILTNYELKPGLKKFKDTLVYSSNNVFIISIFVYIFLWFVITFYLNKIWIKSKQKGNTSQIICESLNKENEKHDSFRFKSLQLTLYISFLLTIVKKISCKNILLKKIFKIFI